MISHAILSYVFDKLFIYQVFASLITYSAINVALFLRVRKRRFRLLKDYGIPGPEPRLIDGSLSLYRARKDYYMVDVEMQKRYGKVYFMMIGDEPNVTITDLEILRKIFFEKMSSFKERTMVFIESPVTRSLLFARYNRWKAMRKTIAPAFSAYTMRGQTSTNFIDEVVRLMIDYIEDKFNNQSVDNDKADKPRLILDIHSLVKSTALKLITGLAIDLPDVRVGENDIHVDSLDNYLSTVDSGLVIFAIKFPFMIKVLEFISKHVEHGKTMGLIQKVLGRKIDQGLKSLQAAKNAKSTTSKQPQLIDTFIKLHYEGKLSRDEVIGNAEALLFAGYDTTSTTLAYIFWVLGMHLQIQDKLRDELMAHGVESKYLMQVVNETMRLYPTVVNFTTRLSTESVSLGDYKLPSGVKVVYNAWLMHRDPLLWPEPEKFDPERFREGVQYHPCAFAPFGLSDRKCIGYSLALLELRTVVCDIICRYRVFTKAPIELKLISYASVLTKPAEKIVMELERL